MKSRTKLTIIKRIKIAQERDDTPFQYREIIPFQKLRPLHKIKNLRMRSIYILHKCGISAAEMSEFLKPTERTIWRELSKAFEIISD